MQTNRDIANDFGFTLQQVRRWSVVACGIDPMADKGKGTIRKYSLDETFKIFMVGELMTNYRMELKEIKELLNKAWSHLSKYNLLPSQIKDGDIPPYDLIIKQGVNYELRKLIDRKPISDNKFNYVYEVIELNEPIFITSGYWKPKWEISLWYHLAKFRKRLSREK